MVLFVNNAEIKVNDFVKILIKYKNYEVSSHENPQATT